MIALGPGKRGRDTPCLLQGDRAGFALLVQEKAVAGVALGLALMTSSNFMFNAQSDLSVFGVAVRKVP